LEALSEQLIRQFGKDFDAPKLRNRRRFYVMFPIQETVPLELSWSHYNVLARVENTNARSQYQQEAIQRQWSVRALDRQISKLEIRTLERDLLVFLRTIASF
jgi:hypothetical protein